MALKSEADSSSNNELPLPGNSAPEVRSTKSNVLIKLILDHFGNTKCVKSQEQISSEAYLIGKIKFSRWFCMPAAIITQFCVGSLYAWSVFNKPIDKLIYGEVVNMAPITFTIAIGFLGFSAAVMGPWLERRGPRIACILGTSLFFIGNLVTSLALYLQQIWLVFLGYGMIGGYGIGLCYISPVSTLQKWFPDHRGLASGIAVCGFGAGSIVMAKVQIPLIQGVGLPLTFLILGSVYFTVMMTGALILRTPPPGFGMAPKINVVKKTVSGSELQLELEVELPPDPDLVAEQKQESAVKISEDDSSLMEALTSRDFRLMYIMFLSNIIFGLVLISRLSNMVTDIFGQSPDVAATVVAINGGFNLAGRLVFSISSDYIGRKNSYTIMLTIQLVIIGLFSTITTNRAYWTFLGTTWTLTSCYGAGFSVIPAFLSDKFGASNIGACHGVILTAWSIAGVVGGLIFTAVFNSIINGRYSTKEEPFPYNVNAWWIFGVVLTGWSALMFVKATEKDRALFRKPREIFCRGRGIRCFNR